MRSRFMVGAILIALQVFLLLKFFHNMPLSIRALIFMGNVVVVFIMLDKDESPSFKIPWLLVCIFLPSVGCLFYLFCGRSGAFRKRKSLHDAAREKTRPLFGTEDEKNRKEIDQPLMQSESYYISAQAGKPLWKHTDVSHFTSGEAAFDTIIEDLEKARHYIFMEFFILDEGRVLKRVLDVLGKKVAEGVEVRMMYDDLGCILKIPDSYKKKMTDMGIKVCVFNPFVPVMTVMHNFRDHRKIIVIDGHTGYTGGINLADEYMNYISPCGYWKDSVERLHGEAVQSLTMLFLETWHMYAGEMLKDDLSVYEAHYYHPEPFQGEGFVQPYGYSPLGDELVAENVYLNLLNHAERYCYIATPYLLANYELIAAIKLAARRGVDVRIFLPRETDAWYVQIVTRGYYSSLIESGVRVYEYTPGFIHEKAFIIDDTTAVTGTVNLDYRSLKHHFECGVWMYKTKAVKEIYEDFQTIQKDSRLLTQADARNIPWYEELLRRILQLAGPLM